MNTSQITTYIQQLQHEYPTERYESVLKTLLENADSGLRAANDRRLTDAGAPAFIIRRGGAVVGYVETLDLAADLNAAENTPPIARFRSALTNFVLTNYLEFRWYVGGQLRRSARVAELRGGSLQRERSADTVATLLSEFVRTVTPTINAASDLAVRLAGMTRELRELILNCITGDAPGRELVEQMQAFRQTLLPDLTPEQFADLYAQTIAYGLFAARIRHRGQARQQLFTRRDAFWDLPATNPLMKSLFQQIEGANLDDRVAWMADALAEVLARADTDAVLSGFRQGRRLEDPINNFYATFLAHYAPEQSADTTPEPVAHFIVRSVDHLLRKRFKRALGVADDNIHIRDPAAGTGTFLYFITQQAYDTLWRRHQTGAWDIYVRDSLLPRVIGFEIDNARYAIAHLKLAIQLTATGYTFASNQRLGMYLTNTLAASLPTASTPLAQAITNEMQQASNVLSVTPVTVFIGQPPHHAQPFIDLAQQYLAAHGCGILAYVIEGDLLNSVDSSALRQHLLVQFDDVYILHAANLALLLLVQRPGEHAHRVRYTAITGDVETWLTEHSLNTIQWQELKPNAPAYPFTPQHADLRSEYDQGWPLTEIFIQAGGAGLGLHLATPWFAWLANSPILPEIPAGVVFPLESNLSHPFTLEITRRLGLTFIPDGRGNLHTTIGSEDILAYIYAILSSPAYRERYAGFLAHEIARVPLTSNRKLLRRLVKRGRQLIALHTMRRSDGWQLLTGYAGPGTNHTVADDHPRFIELAGERGGRIYINRDKYVHGVEREAWNFKIGDVRVLRDWLERRQGQPLEWRDLRHYQAIIAAVVKTQRICREIDDLIPSWPI